MDTQSLDMFDYTFNKRNLNSFSCLDKLGFSFTFGERKINLMLNFQVIGYGSLVDDLYKLSLTSNNIHSSY
ncbi:hypothetical protein CR513_27820, partial [Mucuna pruriens]